MSWRIVDRYRRSALALVNGAVLASSVGCQGETEHSSVDRGRVNASGLSVTESSAAREVVQRLQARRLPESEGSGFLDTGTHLAPRVREGATARVLLPKHGDEPFTLEDASSGASVSVMVENSSNARAEAAGGHLVYRGALGAALPGGDMVQRVRQDGIEDYVAIDRAPVRPELGYRVRLGDKVAGLRLVADTLELVDAENGPRLRMAQPYVIDAQGRQSSARVSVTGCKYDSDPSSPWGRDVTDPGSRDCRVVVRWDEGLAYPALLDPAWTTTGSLAATRAYHTATRILTSSGAERVLVAGGAAGTTYRSQAELFNPATGTWSATASMTVARAWHTAVPLTEPLANNGAVLVCGGQTSGSGLTSSCERYLPGAGSWAAVPAMAVARAEHSAVLLKDGSDIQALIIGGRSGTAASTALASTQLYDPSSNTWAPDASTQDINPPRFGHGSVRIREVSPYNVVLVAGGTNAAGTVLSSATRLLCAPSAASCDGGGSTASMSQPRHRFPMLRLGTERRAFVTSSSGTAYTQIYDDVSNAWTTVASAPYTLTGAIGAPLASSRLLLAGYEPQPPPLGAIPRHVVFDWVQSQWYPVSPLSSPVVSHGSGSATLLGTGSVVVAGGTDSSTTTATTHLFAQQAQGASCNMNGDCASRYCVDGVCCNSACSSFCSACSAAAKGQGSNGTCGQIAAGHSSPDCADQGAGTCGTNGACDGSGSCQVYGSGTQCASPTCSSGTLTTHACNGSGVCTSGASSCAPYICNASGNGCRTNCSSDTHCVSTHFCSGSSCVPKKANGLICTAANQCTSGFCVDGACCDTACTASCMACTAAKKGAGGGADGECGFIVSGADPDGNCAAEAQATCGNDGQCNGSGACRKWAYGASCGQSVCEGNVAKGQICNGSGSCVNDTTGQACDPQLCSGGQCAACTTDAGCIPGHFCAAGTCNPKLADGQTCSGANQCASSFCVDGFCCNTQCSGLCSACSVQKKGQGNDGDCGSIVVGTDPDDECAVGAECQTNGACNGSGACQLQVAGSPCAGTVCVAGDVFDKQCNGTGACVTGGLSTSCAPYLCASGACTGPCTSNSDCVSGHFCDAGACVQKLADGTSCGGDTECQSGHCVDGVCCNTQCSGLCHACTAQLKDQGADGDCGPIKSGFDPDTECAEQSGCGQDGSCSGAGACRLKAAGTSCGATQCQGTTTVVGQVCNGTGACVNDASGTDCSPHLCSAGACQVPCASDQSCVLGYFCDLGTCVQKQANGAVCSGNAECSSGFCADGFCCNAACTSPCMACGAALKSAGLDGECGPAKNGLDPHNDCPDDGAQSCQRDGQCDGAGACRLYQQGVGCGPTTCDGNSVKGKICNGIGTCITDTNGVSCAPYLCQSGGCATSCQNDPECLGSYYCNAGLCESEKGPGTACSQANECATGFCVDGVCCDAACNGQCEACDVAGNEGECTTVSGPPHNDRPACAGSGACQGLCDGTDPTKCSLPGSGTACAAASCSGDVSQPAGECDGAGSCAIPTTKSCLPYACDAASGVCVKSCVSDGDCSQGARCDTASGKCAVSSTTCKDDHTVVSPTGVEQPCDPYRCVGGACRDSCTNVSDCASGFECKAPTCVKVAGNGTETSDEAGGCGCRVVERASSRGGYGFLLLGLSLLLARRRAKSFTVASNSGTRGTRPCSIGSRSWRCRT